MIAIRYTVYLDLRGMYSNEYQIVKSENDIKITDMWKYQFYQLHFQCML